MNGPIRPIAKPGSKPIVKPGSKDPFKKSEMEPPSKRIAKSAGGIDIPYTVDPKKEQ